jgi:hypothetical protein
MKRVSYAGATFLTADEAADALVHLTAALGRAQHAQVVELPAVRDDGRPQVVFLVVGPASQLVATSEESIHPEPESAAVVAELQARTRAVAATYTGAFASQGVISEFDLDEWDQV